jgi:glutaminase
MSPPELASLLCEAAAEGKLGLLRRYIAAGADVNAADYDRRTPMHIAAAEGKLSLVELLVVEGGADLAAADRWGNTPLAEATRVGAAQVVAYLKSDEARQAAVKARQAAAAGAGSDPASLSDLDALSGFG